ncbi:MAG: hypothetical protein R3293_17825 [Candidatus Promineifilaceae bacterium]|nr:hypothetical protein [Candidatus Promineifilaceae bacterium]
MPSRSRFFSILWAISLIFVSLSACNSSPDQESVEEPNNPEVSALSETTAGTATPSQPVATATPLPTQTEIPSTPEPPYPPPNTEVHVVASETPAAYPAPPTVALAPADSDPATDVYLPLTSGNAVTPTPTPPVIPTVDFAAVRADLRANNQELGFAKIGFHTTIFENRDVLDNWMQRLDQAGVPIFIKTVDNAEPLFNAQELIKASGVPHVLVFRSSGSVPHYELEPLQAAQIHWTEHKDKFPPELDPSLVWVETLNEPDRTKAEWLGQFALETARLAQADGFRWAAFGWASGEPEPEQWQTPSMLAFLRLAAENPDRLAIALHEYSYLEDDIAHEYPYKVGRFQELFRIADSQGFPRPTVLITEWGWQYNDVPNKEQVMHELEWAAELYAPYPQLKGAALWNIGAGCCYGDISEQVQELIDPITEFSLNTYFSIPQPPAQQPINPDQFRP